MATELCFIIMIFMVDNYYQHIIKKKINTGVDCFVLCSRA